MVSLIGLLRLQCSFQPLAQLFRDLFFQHHLDAFFREICQFAVRHLFQQSHDLFQRCAAFFLWVHVIQKRRFRLVQHGKACGAQQEDPAAAAHSGERRLGALVADGDALRAAAVVDDCLDKAVQCLLEDGIVVLQRLLRQELVPLGFCTSS